MTINAGPPKSAIVAGLLAWAVPGTGHWYLGWRGHAVLLGVVVMGLFWGGMLIGGVHNTIDPATNTAWFVAQVCGGLNPLAAMGVDRIFEGDPSYGKANELGIVYSGVAGLLNLLVVLDAAARADRPSRTAAKAPNQSIPAGKEARS